MIDMALILAQAGECFGFSPTQTKALSGGHFSKIYEFSRDGKNFVLRVTPPNAEVDLTTIHAVLNWLGYLTSHGASVPSPLVSRGGSLIESAEVCGELYILVAFEKVIGTLAEDLFPGRWNDGMSIALGQAVGKMHAISCGYRPEDARLLRPNWHEISNCFNPSEILDVGHELIARKQHEIRMMIQSLPKDEHSYGLIHADLHFANFMVDVPTQEVTIIDFDDCAYGWYVMDIAMLLLDATVLHSTAGGEAYARNFLKCFLLGYLQEHTLDLSWIRRLPYFLHLLEIGLYVMLYQQYDPDDHTSWVGRFMAGRRERIENGLSYLDIDFACLADELHAEVRSSANFSS